VQASISDAALLLLVAFLLR